MYLHNQIGTVFRFNKDTATGEEPVAVKRKEDVPMVLGVLFIKGGRVLGGDRIILMGLGIMRRITSLGASLANLYISNRQSG